MDSYRGSCHHVQFKQISCERMTFSVDLTNAERALVYVIERDPRSGLTSSTPSNTFAVTHDYKAQVSSSEERTKVPSRLSP